MIQAWSITNYAFEPVNVWLPYCGFDILSKTHADFLASLWWDF